MKKRKRLPSEVRKKQIREAAKKVFLRKGFSETTMEDVVAETDLSKGSVYKYYPSTSAMLHDLMVDGNHNRYDRMDDFLKENSDLTTEDLLIEVTIMKMLDEADNKSLYAMFLMEAEKDPKLKELRDKIMKESKEEFLQVIKNGQLKGLEPLVNDEWIAFMNSIIVATEVLDVREVFLKNKDFFRDIVRQYLKDLREN